MKRRSNNAARSQLTETERGWLNGEWHLGSEPRTPDEIMKSLALMGGIGSNELWASNGNPETHFWRPGLNLPITLSDLEHHEACWLEAGAPDKDKFGGESYFIWNFYGDAEKQKLWDEFGDKENFHWESCLRRPIPRGASIDAAMVAFTTIGPFNIE